MINALKSGPAHWRLIASIAALSLLLAACSPSDDDAWPPPEPTEPDQPVEVEPHQPPAADGRPSLVDFSESEIDAIRQFSDQDRSRLMEENIACDLASPEDITDVFGGNWADGIFRWFERELELAPAALRGVCLWQDVEHRTNITLRVYEASDVAWASLLQADEQFGRRFYERSLEEGPELGVDSYRTPHGEAAVDGSCVRLEDHILCLSGSTRYAEEWAGRDSELIERIVGRLPAD